MRKNEIKMSCSFGKQNQKKILLILILISLGIVWGCFQHFKLKENESSMLVDSSIQNENLSKEEVVISDKIENFSSEMDYDLAKEETQKNEELLINNSKEEKPIKTDEHSPILSQEVENDVSNPEISTDGSVNSPSSEVVEDVLTPPEILIEMFDKELKITLWHEKFVECSSAILEYRINKGDWKRYVEPIVLPIDDYDIEARIVVDGKVSETNQKNAELNLPELELPHIQVMYETYETKIVLSHPRYQGLEYEKIEYRIDGGSWLEYEESIDWLTEWSQLEVRYREGNRQSEIKTETIDFVHPICKRGNATEEHPCIITSPEQLNALQLYVNEEQLETVGKYYELGNDIDLMGFDNDNDSSNGNWTPIGNDVVSFKGNLNGNGYVISNLKIIMPNDNNVGFFGKTTNSSVSNLEMSGIYLEGNEAVGGLIGFAEASTIENVMLKGEVKGNDSKIGGIIGRTISESTLSNLSFSGRVEGAESSSRVGGVVGHHAEGSILRNSFSDATVFAGSNVGGLVGFSNSSFVEESYATGDVSAKSGVVGGLVGQAWGTGEVSKSFATGDVSTREGGSIGGLIGWVNASSIRDAYSTGVVSGQSTPMGGLIGGANNGAVIENSYSMGKVFGANNSGFIGSTTTTIEVNKGVYWDVQTSEQPNSVAGVGLTTSQMTGFNALKYMEGFDFENTWQLCQGDYPQLKAFTTCKPLQTGYAGGSGTKDDPYLISSEQQLDWLRFEVNELGTDTLDVYYELIKSLDFSKYDSDGVLENGNWVPIKTFKGYFNGKGHSIENLKVIMPNNNDVGVFGDLENATIKNIYLTNLRLEGNDRVGGVAGYTANSEIIQVSVQGIVNGKYRVGGVIGSFYNSRLKEVFSDVLVTNGGARTGGIVGSSWSGWISNSFSQSTVLGKQHTGGIVGYNASYSKVENSVNIGQVLGDGQKGGLTGYNVGSTVINSYWNVESALITTTIGEGIGLTTSQMTDFNAFKYIKDFDFENTWQLCEGDYPKLKWENKACSQIPTGYESGVGTKDDPFLIKTAEQLNWLRVQTNTDAVKYTKDKYFKLVDDIDLKDFDTDNNPENGNWIPIGTNEQRFQGTFLGNGHKISNLKVIQPDMDYVGLFGRIGSATIQKVALEDVMIEGKNYVGGLIGYTFYNCYVKDVFVSGLVKGVNHVGSLTGVNYSTLQNIAIATTVESVGIRGPLVGTNYGQVVSAYYDKEVSLESGSLGSPLTTSQMTGLNAIKHMEGFDFEDTWQACEDDYPQLKVFATCRPLSLPDTFTMSGIDETTEFHQDVNQIKERLEEVSLGEEEASLLDVEDNELELPSLIVKELIEEMKEDDELEGKPEKELL